MTPENKNQPKRTLNTYLIYAAIALLIINFLLIFIPFVKVYQPSYSKTVLGITTYEGWDTQSAPMAFFIFPLLLSGIPYLCSIISLSVDLKRKDNCPKKSALMKMKNNTLTKPTHFFWLKFASIANIFAMWITYSQLKSRVHYYEEHGAYCHLTFGGILNIICTISFVVLLFVLSSKSKKMFVIVSKSQMAEINVVEQSSQEETE